MISIVFASLKFGIFDSHLCLALTITIVFENNDFYCLGMTGIVDYTNYDDMKYAVSFLNMNLLSYLFHLTLPLDLNLWYTL
jgi:hypothetical protein